MALSILLLSTALGLASSLSGKATYYGGNPSGGACGYADVPSSTFPNGFYAACGGNTFNDGYGCGSCWKITCIGPYSPNPGCSCSSTTPSVIVSCMDQCPECSDTHFDLDPTSMARIVGPGLSGTCGIIETTVERVSCDYTGNIKIRAKSGTSAYWYGLHIDDVAGNGDISAVKLKSSGSSSYSTTCLKSEGASFWKCDGGFPLSLPISVKLTDSAGETITCNGCISSFAGGAEFDFGTNFGGGVSPATVSTGTPTTATTKTPTTAGSTPSPTTTKEPTTSSGGGVGSLVSLTTHTSAQDYYYSFYMDAPELCGDTITDVQILQQGNWRSYNQFYTEDDGTWRWAFDYTGVAFSQMLPISVRFVMANEGNIDLMGIMETINAGSTYTSTTETLCGGTLSPTPQTPSPTTGTPTAPTTPYPTAQSICIDADTLDWRSYDNEVKLNGNRFNMKGLSWFGYETGNYGLYGLDKHSEDWYFQWMQDRGFNAMRLPFSGDFMFSGSNSLNTNNANTYKATIQKAGEYGIFVMPDWHSNTAGSWTDGLNTINKATVITQWGLLANHLKDEWNVFIADVFNEPHDVENSQWGEWIQFCEDVADSIWATGVNWMVAVEGTNWQCSTINCAWGENLEGVRNSGITFDNIGSGANRFVWSPHVYGSDVTGNPYSVAGWDAHWGYLVDGTHPTNEAASLIGEFGTRYTGGMVNWLDDLVDYLISIDQRNTFFWCLNPNSGDTGGLLGDDWTTPESGKLAALDKLQPDPSVVTYNSNTNKVCIQFDGSGPMATPSPTVATTKTPTTTKSPTPTTTKSPTVSPAPTTTKTPTATTTKSPTTTKTPTRTTTKTPTTRTTTKSPTTGGGSGGSVSITNHDSAQDYYYSFYINTPELCGETIADVQILQQGNWRSSNQFYTEDDGSYRYAWDYTGVMFSSMTPISVRFVLADNEYVTLWGIMESITPGTSYTSTSDSLCGGTSPVTVYTDEPTPAPTEPNLKWENCAGASSTSYTARLVDFPSDYSVSRIWMRDASGNNKFLRGTYDPSTGCYVWTNGVKPYTLPLDIKVKAVGGLVIKKFDVINSWNSGSNVDLGTNFGTANSEAYLDDELDTTSNDDGLSTVELAAIIAISIIFVIAIIGVIIYYSRKRRASKVSFKETDIVEEDVDNTPKQDETDGMVQLTGAQSNVIAIQEDDVDDV